MEENGNIIAGARWAVVGVISLIACALLVSLWLLYSGVQDASQALIRGQAVSFQAALRRELLELRGPASAEDLKYILEEHADSGLRYIALFYSQDQVVSAGHTHLAADNQRQRIRRMKAGVPQLKNGRVLMLSRGVRQGRRRRNQVNSKRKRPPLLIEFEPLKSNALSDSSFRSLAIGASASALLFLLALFLLRWNLRWDKQAEQAAHQRRLQVLGQMSAVLAHEIRNPLASLKGNAQVLQLLVEKDKAESSENIDKIRNKSDRIVSESIRLEGLVNDLLDFAKTGNVTRTQCDPTKLLQDCVAQTSGSTIEIDCTGAPETWDLDIPRMRQVLSNLLRNALQAGNHVTASVFLESGQLVFSIRDDGEGITGDLDELFEPFFTKRTQGTGLGLAVAKKLVALHGGTISAKNNDTRGAEFRVEIPKG